MMLKNVRASKYHIAKYALGVGSRKSMEGALTGTIRSLQGHR